MNKTVDNPEYHAITVHLDLQNSKSIVYFPLWSRKTPKIQKKKNLSGIIRVSKCNSTTAVQLRIDFNVLLE